MAVELLALTLVALVIASGGWFWYRAVRAAVYRLRFWHFVARERGHQRSAWLIAPVYLAAWPWQYTPEHCAEHLLAYLDHRDSIEAGSGARFVRNVPSIGGRRSSRTRG